METTQSLEQLQAKQSEINKSILELQNELHCVENEMEILKSKTIAERLVKKDIRDIFKYAAKYDQIWTGLGNIGDPNSNPCICASKNENWWEHFVLCDVCYRDRYNDDEFFSHKAESWREEDPEYLDTGEYTELIDPQQFPDL